MADNKDIERYKTENLQQKEAFEFYYAMGQDRNLEKVAEQFTKSPRTVYEWSRKFNWQERIAQRDIEVSKKMAEKTINAVADEKANYRKLIKLAIAQFANGLRDGDIKIRSVSDLEKLIKLDLTLMGEFSEITKVENNVGLTEQDRELVKEFAEAMRADMDDVEDED